MSLCSDHHNPSSPPPVSPSYSPLHEQHALSLHTCSEFDKPYLCSIDSLYHNNLNPDALHSQALNAPTLYPHPHYQPSQPYPSPPLTDSELRRTVPLPKIQTEPESLAATSHMPHVHRHHHPLPLSPPPTLPITPQALPEPPSFPHAHDAFVRPDDAADNDVHDDFEAPATCSFTQPHPLFQGQQGALSGVGLLQDEVDFLEPLSPTWAHDLEYRSSSVVAGSGQDDSALLSRPGPLMAVMTGSGHGGHDLNVNSSSRNSGGHRVSSHYPSAPGFASLFEEERSLWLPHDDHDSASSPSYSSELELATPNTPSFPTDPTGFAPYGHKTSPPKQYPTHVHPAPEVEEEDEGGEEDMDLDSDDEDGDEMEDVHDSPRPPLLTELAPIYNPPPYHSDSSEHDLLPSLSSEPPPSPSLRSVPLLPDLDFIDSFRDEPTPLPLSPPPSSPSRRSFSSLPELDDLNVEMGTEMERAADISVDTDMDATADVDDDKVSESLHQEEPSPSSSPKVISFPGAETDDQLFILPDPPPISASHSSSASSSFSSSTSSSTSPTLGLFVPLASSSAAASSSACDQQQPRSPSPELEPDLEFPEELKSRVDREELESLIAMRRKSWVAERSAKRTEGMWAEEAKKIAGGIEIHVSPRVMSTVVCEMEEEEGEFVAGTEKDRDPMRPVRRDLQIAEARRAEARKIRKREKERGKELQALLVLKLGISVTSAAKAGGSASTQDSTAAIAVVGEGEQGPSSRSALMFNKSGKKMVGSMPQLVARMVMKRREATGYRPLGARRSGGDEKKARRPSSRLSTPVLLAVDDGDVDVDTTMDLGELEDLNGLGDLGGLRSVVVRSESRPKSEESMLDVESYSPS